MTGAYEMTTKNGHPFGESASALQKCIRRGLEEEAMYWALEFALAGFHAYLWKRLVVIVTEDIGGANPNLVQTIVGLSAHIHVLLKDGGVKKRAKGDKYDLCILGYVILDMARSPKSRESDDFVNHVLRSRRVDGPIEVPDFALDKHTDRGRKMGRGVEHFWKEGAKLNNEAYTSEYVGWDDELGDGYHSANGEKAKEAEISHENPQKELPI